MQDQTEELVAILRDLHRIAPAGYAAAHHIGFNSPKFMFQTYPAAWLKTYSEKGMVLSDPTVHWGLENTGFARWPEILHLDYAGIMDEALKHDLKYGVTFAHEAGGTRSIASFTKSDVDFEDSECDEIGTMVKRLHDITADIDDVSAAFAERVKLAGVRMTHHVDK